MPRSSLIRKGVPEMKMLLLVAGVGSLLVSGVLLAFSSFVMAGLARIPAASGIAAMQSINITVVNPLFMGLFMGMGAVSLAVLVMNVRSNGFEVSMSNIAAAIYLLGVFGVTFVANVPMNDALAGVDPAASASAEFWNSYLSSWTMWNHVRCVVALVAGVLFVMGRG
jgi:uncharacterized membrane protein